MPRSLLLAFAALTLLAVLAGCSPVLVGVTHPVGCDRLGPVHGVGTNRRGGRSPRGMRARAELGLEQAAWFRGANYVELTYEDVPSKGSPPSIVFSFGGPSQHWTADSSVTLAGIAYRCPVEPPEELPEPATAEAEPTEPPKLYPPSLPSTWPL